MGPEYPGLMVMFQWDRVLLGWLDKPSLIVIFVAVKKTIKKITHEHLLTGKYFLEHKHIHIYLMKWKTNKKHDFGSDHIIILTFIR